MINLCLSRAHPQYLENFLRFPPEGIKGHLIQSWARNRFRAEMTLRKCDLLYCNNCEFPDLHYAKGKPRVGDIESLSYFVDRDKNIESRLEKMHAVLFNTEWALNDLKETVYEGSEKFEFLPQAVRSYGVVEQDADPVTILFVGANFFRKGGDILAEAVRKLDNYDLDVTFKLPRNSSLEGTNYGWLYKYKPLSTHIIHDDLSHEQLHSLFDLCDIFCMPTRWESYGFVFLEAMSHARPILTTNFDPMPEVVGDGGVYINAKGEMPVDTYDPVGGVYELSHRAYSALPYSFHDTYKQAPRMDLVDQCADQLEKLIVSKARRRHIGKEGKKIADTKYSLPKFQKRFGEIAREAVGG